MYRIDVLNLLLGKI